MKKIHILSILFLIPYLAYADEFKYFTFSPFTDTYLDLSLVKSITQIFYPFDDNLNAFRIWIRNEIEPSQIKVSLLKGDNLIKSKSFDIPITNLYLSGSEFKLDFGENISIKSGEEYKIKIDHIKGKGLKIFYSSLVQLLQHTEEYSIAENFVGPLYINNSSSSYAINFVLSEKEENDLPQFKDVKVEIISPYKAIIYFQTNEPVKYKLVYWISNEGNVNVIDFTEYLESCYKPNKCKFEIETKPNSLYIFQIGIKDYWNNLNAYQGTFITPYDPNLPIPTSSPTFSQATSSIQIEDREPPIITSFNITELTTSTITIKFTTNEYTIGAFSIYTYTNKLVLTKKSPIFDILHIISSKPVLVPNYKYYAILKVEDRSNNYTTFRFEFVTSPQGTIKEIFLPTSTPPSDLTLQSQTSEQISTVSAEIDKTNKQITQIATETTKMENKETEKETKYIMDINFNSENSEITINIPQSQLKNFILEIYDKENKLARRFEDIKENKISLRDLNEGVYKVILVDRNSNKVISKKEIEVKNKPKIIEEQRINLQKSKPKAILIFLLILFIIILSYFIYRLFKRRK